MNDWEEDKKEEEEKRRRRKKMRRTDCNEGTIFIAEHVNKHCFVGSQAAPACPSGKT
jgi:hypothetical protein